MADAGLQFLDLQKQSGAVLPENADGARAIHFGDPRAEDEVARTDAALFDLSDRSQIEITGGDRGKFLNNFCTNNVLALKAGEGCEAFITNVKGRILGYVHLFVGDGWIRLESVPSAESPLLAHLDKYLITEDVQLLGRTEEWGELYVSGPQAGKKLCAMGLDVESLPGYGHAQCPWDGIAVDIRRLDLLGILGFALIVPRDHLSSVWERVSNAGIRPSGSAVFEALRIEAGTPLYGADIGEDNLAQEVARTKQAISFTKGCYLGQEPIARIDAMGHVNRELRGLSIKGDSVPPPGTPVLGGPEGEQAGQVTSAAFSYHQGQPVALAYLRSRYIEPGTEVQLRVDDGQSLSASVFWPE